MRGEFRFHNGLILPNNISLAGAQAILDSAFRLEAQTWYVGLVSGAPSLDMTQADMTEPTIGVNGYARVALAHDSVGWPIIGEANGAAYVESANCVFAASGGNFNEPFQRCALLLTPTYSAAGIVVSLSAPLPTERVITPTTPSEDRTFNYRIYL